MQEDSDATAPPGSGETDPVPSDDQVKASPPETSEQEASGEDTEAEQPGAEQTAEEVEIDFGGNRRRFPKGTPIEAIAGEVEAFSKGLWGDYTRKSQEIAEHRKAIEAERSAVAAMRSIEGEALTVYAEGQQIARDLEQLRQIDLTALWQSNPDQARQVSDAISMKQAAYDRTLAKATEIGQRRAEEQNKAAVAEREAAAARAEKGRQIVAAKIKGFDEAAMIDYAAKEYGVEPDIVKQSWPMNPAAAVHAWKAMQWDRAQAQAAKAATSPAAPQPTPVKPMAARSASVKADAWMDDPNISADEWAKRRNAQLAKRRA